MNFADMWKMSLSEEENLKKIISEAPCMKQKTYFMHNRLAIRFNIHQRFADPFEKNMKVKFIPEKDPVNKFFITIQNGKYDEKAELKIGDTVKIPKLELIWGNILDSLLQEIKKMDIISNEYILWDIITNSYPEQRYIIKKIQYDVHHEPILITVMEVLYEDEMNLLKHDATFDVSKNGIKFMVEKIGENNTELKVDDEIKLNLNNISFGLKDRLDENFVFIQENLSELEMIKILMNLSKLTKFQVIKKLEFDLENDKLKMVLIGRENRDPSDEEIPNERSNLEIYPNNDVWFKINPEMEIRKLKENFTRLQIEWIPPKQGENHYWQLLHSKKKTNQNRESNYSGTSNDISFEISENTFKILDTTTAEIIGQIFDPKTIKLTLKPYVRNRLIKMINNEEN